MSRKRDWIEAQFKIAPLRLLDDLAAVMKADVDTFQTAWESEQSSSAHRRFEFHEHDNGRGFSITDPDPRYHQQNAIVVALNHHNRVVAYDQWPPSEEAAISIGAHVSDNGKVHYTVREKEFKHLWQVSRGLLSPLFFPRGQQ